MGIPAYSSNNHKYERPEAEKARGLLGTVILSQNGNKGAILTGRILEKIKKDPDVDNYRQSILQDIGYRSEYLEFDTTINKYQELIRDRPLMAEEHRKQTFDTVTLGGQRSYRAPMSEQWKEPWNHLETWGIAFKEITWLMRNAQMDIAVSIKQTGQVDIKYTITDNLDLSSSKNRGPTYNAISDFLGYYYHVIGNAPLDFKVQASWTETYQYEDIKKHLSSDQIKFNQTYNNK